MDPTTHNKIVSFIWGIADDVLRDLFRRGKYPDVILPMCVIRRMDAVLEATKQQVLETIDLLDNDRESGTGSDLVSPGRGEGAPWR
jgi:type I restriction enzyme M protein